jgi:integrase
MDELEKNVRETISNFHLSNGYFPSTSELKTLIQKKQPEKRVNKDKKEDDFLIIDLFKKFLIQARKDDRTNSTISVYETTKQHWVEFEAHMKKSYRVSNINFQLLEDFGLYLKNNNMMFSTVGKYIKTMKTLINYMIKYEKINVDITYKEIKVEREEENNFVILTSEEYELMRNSVTYSNFELDGERLVLNARERLIGKLFLFMCSTGLSYVDLMNLRVLNFFVDKKELKLKKSSKEIEWMVYLKYDRQKVKKKTECIVPLHHHTLEILLSFLKPNHFDAITRVNMNIPDKKLFQWVGESINKLKRDPNKKTDTDFRLFPPVSNSKFNSEIKLLCQKLGFIETFELKEKRKNGKKIVYKKFEKISSHTGRRTFVTLCLKLGVRPDILMKSTGHLKLDTLRRYNKYDTSSIHEEFENKVVFRNG